MADQTPIRYHDLGGRLAPNTAVISRDASLVPGTRRRDIIWYWGGSSHHHCRVFHVSAVMRHR